MLTLPQPPVWVADALCAQVDPEIFFPRKGEPNTAARRVCAACPVAAECRAHAIRSGEPHGIWGGLTAQQRRTEQPERIAPRPIKHGTPGGERTHRRRGETPCAACREAVNAYRRRQSGEGRAA
ncbi:MAG: hypothetical protein GEU93_09875 [Propionibacteriales bacterium]|nr:hypothetical protein [Propionibacteriales bacterium]